MAATEISDAKPPTEAAAKPPAEVRVEDFSGLVGNMSRILTGVNRLQPFSKAALGQAEWVALTTLTNKDGISNKVLARHLGVTGQRANQIVSSLMRAKLIAVNQSPDDNRVNEIKITDLGRARIEALNSELKPLLATVFEGKERVLAVMSRHARLVMQRVVHANNPEKLARTKAKKAKGKGDAEQDTN